MSVARKTWIWENDFETQSVFLDDCVGILLGEDKRFTRTHVAACADWALREQVRSNLLLEQLAAQNRFIADLCEIALSGHSAYRAESKEPTQ